MWYLVFFLGILLTSTLEDLTSYFMEIIFHMRWWDYSKRKLNINGRVCLLNSLLFGGLVMLVVYGIHPLIHRLMSFMGIHTIQILDLILGIGIVIDTIFSTIKNINIAKQYLLTGIIGAYPSNPPNSTLSPTVLPITGIIRTAVVF